MSAPITETAYIVVCAAEDAILEGPGPTRKSLLLAVAGNHGYDLVVDRPVVIEFEGTPEQIAVLHKLRITAWPEDPGYYEDELADGNETEEDGMPVIQGATELIDPDAVPDLITQMLLGKEGNQFVMFP